MLSNKTSLSKMQKIKIFQSMFPEHNGIRLKIKNNRYLENPPKYLESKQHSFK